MNNQSEITREFEAYQEKIALSRLEEAKAKERTRELEYQFARFRLDVARVMSQQQPQAVPMPPQQEEAPHVPDNVFINTPGATGPGEALQGAA